MSGCSHRLTPRFEEFELSSQDFDLAGSRVVFPTELGQPGRDDRMHARHPTRTQHKHKRNDLCSVSYKDSSTEDEMPQSSEAGLRRRFTPKYRPRSRPRGIG